jgi:predicted transcriptional regulator
VAALDTNVFFDLTESRPGSAESSALVEDWVLQDLELVVTDEILLNISNGDDADKRRRQRSRATKYRQVRPPLNSWVRLFDEMVSRLPRVPLSENDRSDLRQLAKASAAGVPYFVTRDDGLVSRFGALAQDVCGISAIHPSELVVQLDKRRREGSYVPVQLVNTSLVEKRVGRGETNHLVTMLLNTADGERAAELRRHLREAVARPEVWNCMAVYTDVGNVAGAVIHRRVAQAVEVSLIRVAHGTMAYTLARQLVFQQRRLAADAWVPVIRVTDPMPSRHVVEALAAEEFVRVGDHWESVTLPVCATAVRVASLIEHVSGLSGLDLDAIRRELELSSPVGERTTVELERRLWPLKLADSNLITFLIPIRPAFAEDLFDIDLSRQRLFHRPTHLSLSREHVYYRSPRNSGGLRAPARVLWYVSDERGRPGTKAIRAASRIEEVVVERSATLYGRYKHLGVYTRESIERIADSSGHAMALRFVDTELFVRPVPLNEVRSVAARMSEPINLVSPHAISPTFFTEIYRGGTGRVDQSLPVTVRATAPC